MNDAAATLRLDKWLWQARFFKSRSLASKFCQEGRVRVNGEPTQKAHHAIRVGDALTFPIGAQVRVVRVLALGERRGPAPEARALYDDLVAASTRPAWSDYVRRMINRIKSLFAGGGADTLPRRDELQLATAALLVEAASLDGAFDAAERADITRLLQRHFALSDEEVATLIDEAELAVQESGQLYGFTRIVKDRYDAAERIAIIEMLWQVAVADGNVDHFESNLIRRVGGLLFVSDRDRGLAKQRVMAKLR